MEEWRKRQCFEFLRHLAFFRLPELSTVLEALEVGRQNPRLAIVTYPDQKWAVYRPNLLRRHDKEKWLWRANECHHVLISVASITCFITLTLHTCLPRLNALTAGSNVTRRMRSTFTTANRGRVAPFHYHLRTDSSAQTDSANPSRAVVSPAYQIYPFSSGQCENSQPLPVPD